MSGTMSSMFSLFVIEILSIILPIICINSMPLLDLERQLEPQVHQGYAYTENPLLTLAMIISCHLQR